MIAEAIETELLNSLQSQLVEYSNTFGTKIINLKEAIEYQNSCTIEMEREYQEKIDDQKKDIQEHNEDLVVQTKKKLLDEVGRITEEKTSRLEELNRAVRESSWAYDRAKSHLDELLILKQTRLNEFESKLSAECAEYEIKLSEELQNDVERIKQVYRTQIQELRQTLQEVKARNREKFCLYKKNESLKESAVRELKGPLKRVLQECGQVGSSFRL